MTVLSTILLLVGGGETDNPRPEIFFVYAGTESARVRMFVDGVDVSDRTTREGTRVSYVPSEDLAEGPHQVRVEVAGAGAPTLVKRWSFRVKPAAVSFVRPTPPNGAILSAPQLPARVVVRAAEDVPVSISLNGGPFEPAASRREGDRTLVDLSDLRSGTCTVRAGDALYTSFSVDADAPRLRALRIEPARLTRSEPVRISALVDDAPFGEIREMLVELRADDRVVEQWSGRPLDGAWTQSWTPSRLSAGVYALHYRLTDWAGNVAEGDASARLVVSETIEGIETVDLRLDRLRPQTTDPLATVSGNASPGCEVELFVNGRSVARTHAAGSGDFVFRGVALESGRNRISALAEDLASGRRSPERHVTTTLVDAVAVGGGRPVSPVLTESPATSEVGAPKPPAAPVITHPPKDQTIGAGTIAVGGSAEAGSTIAVYVDDVERATATVNGGGRFNVARVPLTPGANVITVRARTAGGEGPPSAPVTVTVKDP